MLKEKFSQYLHSERNYSVHTRIAYLNDLDNLFSFIEENTGQSIFEKAGAVKTDHRQLRSWMGNLLESGVSKRTVARKLAAASTYFKFLRKSGVVDANPVAAAASDTISPWGARSSSAALARAAFWR